MARKNNENKATNASIIEVVINGMSAIETVEDIKARLESIEKSVFNVALECAYALGKTIPSYVDNKGIEHGVLHKVRKGPVA